MNQEDKELLLKDLCARLPYRVKCKVTKRSIDGEMLFIRNGLELTIYNVKALVTNDMYEVKPYLFHFSSMTDEQKKEYQYIAERWMYDSSYSISDSTDWLNENYIDYRGFIEKGLAIDATGLNIYC